MNTPFNEFSEEIDSSMIVQMYQHLLQNRIVAKYLIKTLYQLEQRLNLHDKVPTYFQLSTEKKTILLANINNHNHAHVEFSGHLHLDQQKNQKSHNHCIQETKFQSHRS